MTDKIKRPYRELGARLRAERNARRWTQLQLAWELHKADGNPLRPGASILRQIRRWEAGDHEPGQWRKAYAIAFGIPEHILFGVADDPYPALPLLVTSPITLGAAAQADGPLTVAGVEGMLGDLYRLEAEFGGNDLCQAIGDHVQAATRLFTASSLGPSASARLFSAVAGLTQMAGWLSIDASRHGDASRYLGAAVYAAHEVGDLGLAAHGMGYLSLHAFYRDRPTKALALANTATGMAVASGSARTAATLHNRVARAHARLGDDDACRRALDSARTAYGSGDPDADDPQWIQYVTDPEIAGQRGACLLDLGRPAEAIEALTEAITLVEQQGDALARDLAHYKTRRASAYLLAQEPTQAVEEAVEVHEITTRIGSARVDERFAELVAKFQPYDLPEVRALLERVRSR
jgi:tetratricopeptide (TPR) repeat protein